MRKWSLVLLTLVAILASSCRRDSPQRETGAEVTTVSTNDCDDTSQVASLPLQISPDRSKPLTTSAEIEDLHFALAGYVIKTAALWDPRDPLTVCFIGGDEALRSRIRDAAMEWIRPGRANLKFDFGAEPGLRTCLATDTSNVRIGFAGRGYNSYVGTEATLYAKPGAQTMNLERFEQSPPPDPHFAAVVMHEFGHALGFEHEHQSPTGGCDAEFNWDKLYAEFCKYPNRWNRRIVDTNLRKLQDSEAYILDRTPDRLSIMHYSFGSWMFVNGDQSPCYVPENLTLSDGDIEGARRAYPTNPNRVVAERLEIFEKSLAALPPNDSTFARVTLARAVSELQ